MRSLVADEEFRGHLNFLAGIWIEPRQGGEQVGVPVLRAFNPSIQVQYFTGYGQTLLQYNETSHALRAGLCLWY